MNHSSVSRVVEDHLGLRGRGHKWSRKKVTGAMRHASHPEDGDDAYEGSTGIVKMTLNSFCAERYRPQLVSRISSLVRTINQAVAEAYLFANFHFSRCLSNPEFDVTTLPKLDRNFYYRCLLAVSVSNARADTLGDALKGSQVAFDALRPPDYRKADIRPYNQVVADTSIQMATMACNSVWANIERFVTRYLRLRYPCLKRFWKLIVSASVQQPKTPLEKFFPPPCSQNASRARQVAEHLRSLLPLPSGQPFSTRAHLAMRLFHTILGDLAGATDVKHRPRLFNILPRKSAFTISYVPISSMTLMKLLGMGETPLEKIKGDGRSENHRELWAKYFNLKAVETRRAGFDERILTDGKGVSIQRRVAGACAFPPGEGYPADATRAECKLALTSPVAEAVGVDPGMLDIVTCAASDGSIKSVSSGRFSQMAGLHVCRRRISAWNAETSTLTQSIPSSRTTDAAGIEAHVRGFLTALPALSNHRFEKGYRSMRFFRYVRKQKAIDAVCDIVAPKDKLVVVGFGDWSNNGEGISRRCSGPIREIRKRLSDRPNVLFKNVDEHRSSCTCHGCFHTLSNMRADSVVNRRRLDGDTGERVTERVVARNSKVHKVLHCCHSVGSAPEERCGTTWNRDVNAAKNLLMLLRLWVDGKERPEAFQRKQRISRGIVRTRPSPASRDGEVRGPVLS